MNGPAVVVFASVTTATITSSTAIAAGVVGAATASDAAVADTEPVTEAMNEIATLGHRHEGVDREGHDAPSLFRQSSPYDQFSALSQKPCSWIELAAFATDHCAVKSTWLDARESYVAPTAGAVLG